MTDSSLPMYVAGEQCPPTPCREWQGLKDDNGYGRRNRKAFRTQGVHRQIMAMVHGEDALVGLSVMHLCDNPPCFRYDHLRVGTHGENMGDAASKNRVHPNEAHGMAKLTDEQVAEIRRRYRGKQNRRNRTGPTQRELADEYGVHNGHISMIINGLARKVQP